MRRFGCLLRFLRVIGSRVCRFLAKTGVYVLQKAEAVRFDVIGCLFPEPCGEGGGAVDVGEAEVAALEGVG
jgi:hypothetical protein